MVVTLSQYVYEQTHQAITLGLLGLSLFLPRIVFALFAGNLADKSDRRRIMFAARLMGFVLSVILVVLMVLGHLHLFWIYFILFLMGIANTYDGPANQALVTELVDRDKFSRAVAWNSWTMQTGFVVGPLIAGFVYALTQGALAALVLMAVLRGVSAYLIYRVKKPKNQKIVKSEKEKMSFKELFLGLKYVFQNRLLLGIISLDFVAVLFGGVVSLMPIFANDILHVGAWGLGFLRAMPSVGALLMALWLAVVPLKKNVGVWLLNCVGVFGIFTILFSFSTNFILSLVFLFIIGASDMISVVIRGVLVQTQTPAELRGRVSAVNLVFIGASNELGEFESGLLAQAIGAVGSAVFGAGVTLLVVVLWYRLFPSIKRCDSLDLLE